MSPYALQVRKRDIIQRDRRLAPVEIPAQYLLSDQELKFMRDQQGAFNKALDNAVAQNTGGRWPHIRIVCVNMDAAVKTRQNSLGPCGGIFSLDLVHPSSNGYTLLANQYIDLFNGLISSDKFFGVNRLLQGDHGYVPEGGP